MSPLVRLAHLFFALLALAAIFDGYITSNQSLLNYFSLFTILSTVLAALVFLHTALSRSNNLNLDSLRGATAVYLLISSAVFYWLLANALGTPQIPWINTTLHKIMPTVFLADWIIFPPKKWLKLNETIKWLVFPLIYLAYTLIRGKITGWYPYSILNPAGGYQSVFIYTVLITAAGLFLSALIIILGNLRARLTSKNN